MRRYGVRDDQFARIEHFLPGRPGHVGRNSELGNRLFVEAVIWKFRSGRRRGISRALRQLEEHSHAVLAVGEERRVEKYFKTLADDPDNEYPMMTSPFTPNATSSSVSFNSSNSSEASRPATKKPRAISSPACIWSAPWPGSNQDTP